VARELRIMAEVVYILCTITSAGCALLLLRQARQSGGALLFWSGIAFVCFAVANVLLFLDLVVFLQADLKLVRNVVTLAGIGTLLYGLIWETS
jgi:hypothetical protein